MKVKELIQLLIDADMESEVLITDVYDPSKFDKYNSKQLEIEFAWSEWRVGFMIAPEKGE